MSDVGRHGDDHQRWDELAVGWALHALEPEDESVFAAHLTGCDRCARTVAETAEVMAAMAGDLPQAEPSEGLRERLRAAVEETEQLPQTRPHAERPGPPAAVPPIPADPPRSAPSHPAAARSVQGLEPSRFGNLRAPLPVRPVDPRPAWRRVLPTALVAAAVAAVLSLGAWNVALTSDRDAAQATAAEQSAVLDDLLTAGRATIAPVLADGAPVATVVAREDQVQVVSRTLSVNDSHDSTYVVWGLQDGVPEALGTFDVVTPQTDLRTVGSTATGLDDYSEYAISIEPGREAPSSPTDIVGRGQVAS
ncbi:conserved protein of unknown function [Modestobacter italicus]|uniref:Regulator of SigK n=1 Tax=Modestobacter italicus (strain DSM 44449 / CECT 9708 / BC 501) TaxID=2732864 RepID=I4EZH2_MODI5|nr:anti-sigma factor [Modestobacter marinus]CCH88785.1 conserved protein of unknown function [Modestobacter marinus]